MQSGQASVGINAEVMVMLVKRCADLVKHQNHDQQQAKRPHPAALLGGNPVARACSWDDADWLHDPLKC